MSFDGWVKTHRKMMSWEWYQDSQMVHLMIHLIMKANSRDKEWRGMPVKRGQIITGRKVLSAETGISEQSIRTCLNRLKKSREISIKPTSKFSVITICNYEEYQISKKQINQQHNQQPTSNQPTTNHKQEEQEEQEEKNTLSGKKPNGVPFKSIVSFLNEKSGKEYKPDTKTTQQHIRARWNEGFRFDDFKAVIELKINQWKNDPERAEYIRPQTLFGTKFESYLQAAKEKPERKSRWNKNGQ